MWNLGIHVDKIIMGIPDFLWEIMGTLDLCGCIMIWCAITTAVIVLLYTQW
jgi:hypothetical protein